MLDQNTDRIWYVIGAVLIGAAIILILNGTAPNLFASVAGTYDELMDNASQEINKQSLDEEDMVQMGQTNDFSMLSTGSNGADVTVTPNQSVDEWGTSRASRIQTNGGETSLKTYNDLLMSDDQVEGRNYVFSVYAKNIGENPLHINNHLSDHTVIQPGESEQVVLSGIGLGFTNQHGVYPHWQFRIQTKYGEDHLDDELDFLLYDLRWGYEKEDDRNEG